jgi:signal transduction histidine kinase
MASQKKLELIVDDSQPLPPVWADPSHITRVIENLVGNAIKHSWSGTITIAASPSTSGCIRCSVRDSGPGIPTDKLDLITKPFQQLQDSISDGVGLGLAIAKLLTEANKGTFSVISEVGKGSEFSIDLPVWDGGDFRGGGGERTD